MGKIKTVVMGDEKAEEAARKKAEAKRAQKKAEKQATKHKEDTVVSPTAEEVAQAPAEVIASAATEISEVDSEKKTKKEKSGSKKTSASNKYKAGPGKKYAAAASLVDKNKTYSLSDAISLVKKTSFSKFDGSVELHINVADKGIRGTVSLPHGTGKEVRVKIADDKLVADLTASGKIDFDILVASPDMMPKLARVAKILGPKGLMPNPKTGTIGADPEKLAKQLSQGQVQWKTQNDFPIIHAVIGKVSFENKKLEENFAALTKSIGKDKIRSLFIKPTMGPSLKVSL